MKNIEILEKVVDENQEMTEEDLVFLSEVLYNLPYIVRELIARNKTVKWLEKELHECKDYLNYLETSATGTLEGLRKDVLRKKEEIDKLEWILRQLSNDTEEFKRQNSNPKELTKEVLKIREKIGFLPGEWK